MDRPLGVTILSILYILAGLLGIIGSLLLSLFGASIIAIFISPEGGPMPPSLLTASAGLIAGFMALILLIFSVIDLIVGIGLYNGRDWARVIALIFAVIGLIGGILSIPIGIIWIVINAIIIWYLTRPHVKRFFSGLDIEYE